MAKLSVDLQGNTMNLLPFVLHPTFLLRAALKAFTGAVKGFQKTFVLSIEAERKIDGRWLQLLEGQEANLQVCRFCLCEQERRKFGCSPMNEEDIQQLLDIVEEFTEQRKKSIEGTFEEEEAEE